MKTANNSAKRILQIAMVAILISVFNFSSIATTHAESTVTNDRTSALTVEQTTTVTNQMLANPTFWPDFLKETEDTGSQTPASTLENMVNDSLYWQNQIKQFIQAENDTLTNL